MNQRFMIKSLKLQIPVRKWLLLLYKLSKSRVRRQLDKIVLAIYSDITDIGGRQREFQYRVHVPQIFYNLVLQTLFHEINAELNLK